MTSPDPLVSVFHFTLTGTERALIESAAAEHRLSVAAWIKAVAVEMATTIAQNRDNRTARRNQKT